MSRGKLSQLMGATLQWLEHKGLNSSDIRRGVLRMIKNYKKLKQDMGDKLTMCRHCLMESVSLFMPLELEQEFNKQFTNVYDFNSVIY
jgi:hypothetical protein